MKIYSKLQFLSNLKEFNLDDNFETFIRESLGHQLEVSEVGRSIFRTTIII